MPHLVTIRPAKGGGYQAMNDGPSSMAVAWPLVERALRMNPRLGDDAVVEIVVDAVSPMLWDANAQNATKRKIVHTVGALREWAGR